MNAKIEKLFEAAFFNGLYNSYDGYRELTRISLDGDYKEYLRFESLFLFE